MNASSARTVLITGANKGIGYEIARQLGAAGLRIWLGARNAEAGEAAAATLREGGADVRAVHIDLLDPATIAAAAARIDAEDGRLDVLINNAGINDPRDGRPGSVDMEAVRRIFETNFFGTLAVTQAMLPLLRKSPGARIVNQSSDLGSLQQQGNADWKFAFVKSLGYSASKAALNMLTVHLAAELREAGIAVNSANPGATATDLNGHRGHQTVDQGASPAVRLALMEGDPITGGFFGVSQVDPW
ncbi:dehydrogenase [Sphingobium jiangsuense]|uniref:NAD(P)-dependent dehydrogenase (Short-subunit alcohol dehydrogenase family) n=1 Tax=Sphingobium jiangsuense TaxID=870476 RepID=A0A7W6BHE7_9SPHN|nr:SDR family NAD(P)-dependent oxidoreductase [Sphingobium jiangsuense]MBB3927046.1 NAD(P)-dependent dehydrogenase (short-subunit alcohol dehydrogenase family) [Sphingobium jiangsuense]GLT00287.1 dehydrogenase [Sphingobium jiangsuense]